MPAEAFFLKLKDRFEVEAPVLNALDAAIGDGDHGATMLRGLTKAATAENGTRARAFMRASGVASGTLFGLILLEIEAHLDFGAPLHAGLSKACTRICDLGEVALGDKTMVDALNPAIDMLETDDLRAAIVAAKAGRDATAHLSARRGRAQYVENGGQGHMDPGAVSVVVFLETLGEMSA